MSAYPSLGRRRLRRATRCSRKYARVAKVVVRAAISSGQPSTGGSAIDYCGRACGGIVSTDWTVCQVYTIHSTMCANVNTTRTFVSILVDRRPGSDHACDTNNSCITSPSCSNQYSECICQTHTISNLYSHFSLSFCLCPIGLHACICAIKKNSNLHITSAPAAQNWIL
jgi:hypothetical protein